MTSPKRLARIAGLLYLVLAVCGGFAELYVRSKVYKPGDAAATAQNVVANSTLFRLGFVADLIMAASFLFVAMALYLLLRGVNENVARVMVVFVAVGVAVICLNLLNHFAALLVATDASYAGSLAPGSSNALVLLLLDMHHYGYLIAQLFFGLWLLPLGFLVYKSAMFPRALGTLLIAGCIGYLVDMLCQFLIRDFSGGLSALMTAPADVAELGLILWLLVKGVRIPVPAKRIPVTV